MENIIKIGMEMIEEKDGIRFRYKGGLLDEVAKKLSDERIERIQELINEVTHEISEGLAEYRILGKLIEKRTEERKDKIDELRDRLYEMLPDDMKKEVDEFRSNMDKLETTEERLAYAFQELAKTMDKK